MNHVLHKIAMLKLNLILDSNYALLDLNSFLALNKTLFDIYLHNVCSSLNQVVTKYCRIFKLKAKRNQIDAFFICSCPFQCIVHQNIQG